MADEELPLVAENIYGYRAWYCQWNQAEKPEPLLTGLVYQAPWRPGVQDAMCASAMDYDALADMAKQAGVTPPPPHKPPARHCRCGFWCYLNPIYGLHEADILGGPKVYLDVPGEKEGHMVTGVIRVSGTVEECTQGYRAERAEIVALSPPRFVWPEVLYLLPARRFGWPTMLPRFQPVSYPSGGLLRDTFEFPQLDQLGDAYGVPVFDSFQEMAAHFTPDRPVPSADEISKALHQGFDAYGNLLSKYQALDEKGTQ